MIRVEMFNGIVYDLDDLHASMVRYFRHQNAAILICL